MMGRAQHRQFDDLVLDEDCMFAYRDGRQIRFTRNERAVLLALSSNPQRLMSRSRLLDEITVSDSDISDRNIDLLINKLRGKLGDSVKTPRFIATQYGEGYIWVGRPARGLEQDTFLAIDARCETLEEPSRHLTDGFSEALREMVSAAMNEASALERRKVVILQDGFTSEVASLRYVLRLGYHVTADMLQGTATLHDMPSRHIVAIFRFTINPAQAGSVRSEAAALSSGILDRLHQASVHALAGLGMATDQPTPRRIEEALTRLYASAPDWLAKGPDLPDGRREAFETADAALQWCLHLFARLVMVNPFEGVAFDTRMGLESEIEDTVLAHLPEIDDKPLLMIAAAKLLYFIDRGHLALADDLAERAFARPAALAATYPVLSQLHYARGRFDDALRLLENGIALATPGSDLASYLTGLKFITLSAAGDQRRARMAAESLVLPPNCPKEFGLMLALMQSPAADPLPAAIDSAFAGIGPSGAQALLEYVYFTFARHLLSPLDRAALMRNMVSHTTRRYGRFILPCSVDRRIGLTG
jgi:DNA-binding winged helix-turn-helix (wHTH) protein/tetratricopeptide (TPR) repeat protein